MEGEGQVECGVFIVRWSNRGMRQELNLERKREERMISDCNK